MRRDEMRGVPLRGEGCGASWDAVVWEMLDEGRPPRLRCESGHGCVNDM